MDSRHQQAEQRAAEWLTKRDSDVGDARDQSLLDEWLEASPVHAVAFIRLEATWLKADRYRALGAGFPPLSVPAPEELSRSPVFEGVRGSEELAARARAHVSTDALAARAPTSRAQFSAARTGWHSKKTRIRWAAAAAVAVVTAGLTWQQHLLAPAYRTPVGGLASIPMTDGSHVTLNTDSAIRVAVTDRERSVQLERGEAFFDVARDPHRPFIVRAGDKRIVVLGTQFSVRRDGDEVRVAVAEGKVRLEDESGNASAAAIERSSKAGAASVGDARESLVLEAGGIARMGGQSVLVQSQPVPDVEDALSWRSGFVIFRNVDLAHAVAEFNRYNGRKIVIQDADVGDIRLSGKFKATNFDAFVRLLEEGFPITFRAPR